MKLTALQKEIGVLRVVGDTAKDIKGICYDSRKAEQDFLFVAIVGFETDGHAYIESAVERGATAVLVQEGCKIPKLPDSVTVLYATDTRKALSECAAAFYGHPERKLKIVGVTGTNGKTTVTTLVKQILEFEGKSVGLIGTNEIVILGRVLPAERTTPESLELFSLFSDMVYAGVEYVVMEVSSHSLELCRVHGINFCVGAFTNLTRDHLDFHLTMENYFAAKNKLFSVCEKAVINTDDAWGKKMAEGAPCACLTYGVEDSAHFLASDIKNSARGVVFSLCEEENVHTVRLGIPGKFSVYNALCAIGTVCALGISTTAAVEALTFAKGVLGRCETVYTKTDYAVIIDYAHTPDGLENIIKTVREFTKGRVITLFGCGGDRDKTKRPIMGEVAARLSDFCIVTSDNPRTEEPGAIIEDILVGVNKLSCDHVVIENRREAILYALTNAKPGDSVILAGKGHETYQIIGKTKHHFDEREVIADCLFTINQQEVLP